MILKRQRGINLQGQSELTGEGLSQSSLDGKLKGERNQQSKVRALAAGSGGSKETARPPCVVPEHPGGIRFRDTRYAREYRSPVLDSQFSFPICLQLLGNQASSLRLEECPDLHILVLEAPQAPGSRSPCLSINPSNQHTLGSDTDLPVSLLLVERIANHQRTTSITTKRLYHL